MADIIEFGWNAAGFMFAVFFIVVGFSIVAGVLVSALAAMGEWLDKNGISR